MEVILKESIQTLGKAGDVVNVANGYARNFLLPSGKALVADRKNVSELARQRDRILAVAAKQRQEYEALAARLAALDIRIPVRVGEEERLYGSVTSMDIAKAIESQGYSVDRRKIQMEEPIKTTGEFAVPVKLSPEVSATLKVQVLPLAG